MCYRARKIFSVWFHFVHFDLTKTRAILVETSSLTKSVLVLRERNWYFLCQSQIFSGQARVPFFWSNFLSSWSQSCAKTQKLGRKKKRSYVHVWGQLLHTPEHKQHQWNDSKFLFFFFKENEKQKKKERKKERKKLLERTWAHFILMKPGEEGVGVVECKSLINSLQVEQKEKERKKKKEKCTHRFEQTLSRQAQEILTATCMYNARCWNPLCWHDLRLVAL